MKRKILIVLLVTVVFLLANNALSEDWYFAMESGACVKASEYPPPDRPLDGMEASLAFLSGFLGRHISSPADLIKVCQRWEVPCHVNDKIVGGRAVEVTVTILKNHLVSSGSLTFYRLEQCKAKATERSKKLKSYE